MSNSKLSFATLRGANAARLPQFRNSKGEPAHSSADGSDWTPAQWLQAVVGELGELARVRLEFEDGSLSREEFERLAAKEVADVQIYLDILARRFLDSTYAATSELDPAHTLMCVVADLGEYANARKKRERGDFDRKEFFAQKTKFLGGALRRLGLLIQTTNEATGNHIVTNPHPTGIDLAAAVVEKFNETSDRVGSSVKIREDTAFNLDVRLPKPCPDEEALNEMYRRNAGGRSDGC